MLHAHKAIRGRLLAVLQLLAEILSGNNANQTAEAHSLLKAMESHCILTLGLMCDIVWKDKRISPYYANNQTCLELLS